MKRIEILESKTRENKKDFINTIKKDIATIDNLIGVKKLELINIEESVNDFLSDSKLTIDNQFLVLYSKKQSINNDLQLLTEIKKEYF